MMPYYVYVIQLDPSVQKVRGFCRLNPEMNPRLPCYYVGQSFHSPEKRFWQHKQGYKGNRFVKKFGLGLCPQYYETMNPIKTRKEAETAEQTLAMYLRSQGHGVWSH